MSGLKRFLFCSLIGALAGCQGAASWRGFVEARRGVQKMKEMDFNGAQQHFQEALIENPFVPELHLDVGVALRKAERSEDALKSYHLAQKYAGEKNQEMLFLAWYNQGELAQALKKTDEALAAYQEALFYRPDSVETKTNIEILMKNQQGQGGENSKEDQKDDQKNQKNQQKSDQKKENEKDQKKNNEQDQQKKEPPPPQGSKKYQPREFKGELKETDVKKILGEINQQEQKIRADYNRQDAKEAPRGKDW